MLLNGGEVCRLLGLSEKQLSRWIHAGAIHPERMARGPGDVHIFTLPGVLGVALATDLRPRGFALWQIAHIVKWFQRQSFESLRSQWQHGNGHLLLFGDRPVLPELLSREAIFDGSAIDLESVFGAGVPVAIIDVERCYKLIREKIASRQHLTRKRRRVVAEVN